MFKTFTLFGSEYEKHYWWKLMEKCRLTIFNQKYFRYVLMSTNKSYTRRDSSIDVKIIWIHDLLSRALFNILENSSHVSTWEMISTYAIHNNLSKVRNNRPCKCFNIKMLNFPMAIGSYEMKVFLIITLMDTWMSFGKEKCGRGTLLFSLPLWPSHHMLNYHLVREI